MKPGQYRTVFIGIVNSDSTEGRGYDKMYSNYVFTSYVAAEESVSGKDVMGSNGRVQEALIIYAEDGTTWLLGYEHGGKIVTVSDVSINMIESLRKAKAIQALEKLSPEEISILGIDKEKWK